MRFCFDDQLIDVDRRELRRCGELIALEPQVFDLLVYLVRNRDHVVSKDDLLAAVWGGRIVSESAVTSRITAVRKAVGDSGAVQRLIRTVPRKGIRFVGVVREEQKPAAPIDAQPVVAENPARPPLPLPDKPSIAVLPFQNMSGDPEQEYFADGMVEEIITALSRIHWLFVIARNSSFTYRGQTTNLKQVGRELGVRYVLEGSVRKGRGRVRITAQLIEAETGAHLWADHFDGSLEDVFDLQDKVASSVAGVIEPALQAAETARLALRPTNDLTAYDLYLRAVARFFPVTRDRVHEALGLLEQAIGRDPEFAPALAWAAICQLRLHVDGWTGHPEAAMAKGIDFARQALQAAAHDPATIANSVFALAYFGEDIGAMMALIDQALALNPSLARGWYVSGMVRLFAGELEVAIKHAEITRRLSPRISVGGHYHTIGRANFFKRRFEEAMSMLLVAVQEQPGSSDAFRFLAATYAHSGRLEEAREVVRQLRAITPVVVPSMTPYRKPEHRELYLSGLRLVAG